VYCNRICRVHNLSLFSIFSLTPLYYAPFFIHPFKFFKYSVVLYICICFFFSNQLNSTQSLCGLGGYCDTFSRHLRQLGGVQCFVSIQIHRHHHSTPERCCILERCISCPCRCRVCRYRGAREGRCWNECGATWRRGVKGVFSCSCFFHCPFLLRYEKFHSIWSVTHNICVDMRMLMMILSI